MEPTPRLRMFAGPNGSGKSVLKSYLSPDLLGVYLNPDEIESSIRQHSALDLSKFGIETTADEVLPIFTHSDFLKNAGLEKEALRMQFSDESLDFSSVEVNSYFASVAVDFIRRKLLQQSAPFTLETVMSHPGKIELLKEARRLGYRTYLYFVATEDPVINISRVRNRVNLGGHSVPEDKIVSRYHRSLDLLIEAIKHTNRAYIFDNSTDNADNDHTWLAEVTQGHSLELKTSQIPAWFLRAVLEKIVG